MSLKDMSLTTEDELHIKCQAVRNIFSELPLESIIWEFLDFFHSKYEIYSEYEDSGSDRSISFYALILREKLRDEHLRLYLDMLVLISLRNLLNDY